MLSDFELGWLCGILEGEGHFRYNTYSQSISVGMCDEDVVNKVATYFERVVGEKVDVKFIKQAKEHWSPQWNVTLHGECARIVMRLVVKYMGTRRRKRIWQSLNKYEPKKVKMDIKAIVKGLQERETENVVSLTRR